MAGNNRRVSRLGYVHIWLRLHQSPANSFEVAEALSIAPQSARQILWAMVRVGTLDVMSWAPRVKSGLPLPVFAPGEGAVARYPGNIGLRRLPGQAKRSRVPRTDMVSFGVLIQCLRDGMRLSDIAEACGGSQSHLRIVIRQLHAAKAIHVSDWTRRPRECKWAPVYELGSKPDAKRPKPLTSAQKHQRAVERREAMRMHSALGGGRGVGLVGRV